MYIEPNSEVYLLGGVSLDPTQRNTIYFENKAKQEEYFKSKVIESFLKVSYQRVNRGYFRCGINAERVYTCNYMMFRNTAFGDKWFYAFVTKVEYVNDMTTQIEFVIDPIQTYWFDIQLLESFVEREHSKTDEWSDWIVDENLPTGQMQYDQLVKSGLFDEWSICVISPYSITGAVSEVGMNFNGIESPVFMYKFDDVDSLCVFISNLSKQGLSESILSINYIPSTLLTSRNIKIDSHGMIYDIPQNKPSGFSVQRPTIKIGTYEPKNGKLFAYPYSYLTVSNSSGDTVEYRYELFERDKSNPFVTFNVYADFVSNMYVCAPVNYCGSANTQTSKYGDSNVNLNFAIGMSGCPQIPWTTDTYKIYMAQNKVSMLANTVGGISAVATGVATKNPSTALVGLNSVKNVMLESESAKTKPVGVHGVGGGNNSIFDSGCFDFYSCHTHVQPEIAKTIDDFFTEYGYATKRVKKPNINVRPHWTYTKTIGCNLKGNAPSDDLKAIKDIFDNGITFWKNGDEIGNYSLDNSV